MASLPQHLIAKFNQIFGGTLLVFGSHYIFTSWINEFLVEEGRGNCGKNEQIGMSYCPSLQIWEVVVEGGRWPASSQLTLWADPTAECSHGPCTPCILSHRTSPIRIKIYIQTWNTNFWLNLLPSKHWVCSVGCYLAVCCTYCTFVSNL